MVSKSESIDNEITASFTSLNFLLATIASTLLFPCNSFWISDSPNVTVLVNAAVDFVPVAFTVVLNLARTRLSLSRRIWIRKRSDLQDDVRWEYLPAKFSSTSSAVALLLRLLLFFPTVNDEFVTPPKPWICIRLALLLLPARFLPRIRSRVAWNDMAVSPPTEVTTYQAPMPKFCIPFISQESFSCSKAAQLACVKTSPEMFAVEINEFNLFSNSPTSTLHRLPPNDHLSLPVSAAFSSKCSAHKG